MAETAIAAAEIPAGRPKARTGEIAALRGAEAEAAARARAEQARLHVNAVRQLIRYLRPAGISETLFLNGEGIGRAEKRHE